MSIIQGNAKTDITPWLCGRCLNFDLTIDKENISGVSIWTPDLYAVKDGLLRHERVALTADKYEGLGIDIIEMLKMLLEKKGYITGCYDEFYIPGKSPYQRERSVHDYVLFGYDDSEEVFYSAGYLNTGKYDVLKIKYEDMRKSLESLIPDEIFFDIWTYRDDAEYKLNVSRIINGLIAYINPEDKHGKGYFWDEDEEYSGINAMIRLNEYFRAQMAHEGRFIDSRYTRILMEHKYYMYKRADYIVQNRGEQDSSISELFHKNYNMARQIHMLGLKINMTGKKEEYERMDQLFQDIVRNEQRYIPDMIDIYKRMAL